jgi:glycosyltransferase involved in cell wall biosynthesis
VVFAFASRGIGGAERSMLRLMGQAHPEQMVCSIVVFGPGNGAFEAAARGLGVPYAELSPLGLRAFRRVLLASRPDVLYMFGRFRTLAWAITARRAGVPCIVAAERSAGDRWSDRWARRLDSRLVSGYVANTEHAGRQLSRVSGDAGPPVSVVPNGISLSRRPTRRGDEAPSLVCVGNISRNKGQGVLLDAVRMLQVRYAGLRATLVGRDFTGGRFFRQAEKRGLGGTFRAVGFVADVEPHLEAATALVLPTLHREGMPTAILESMRAGVPVVASRVGGVAELVEDGVTGLLASPGDPAQLARAIARLIEDSDLRARLARAARRQVEQRYSLGAMVEGHLRAFALARAFEDGRRYDAPAGAAQVAHITTADVSLRYLLLNQLCAVRDRGYVVAGVSSPGPDVPALEQAGIPHLAVPMTRRLTPFPDVLSLLRLWRLFRSRRFTVVHTHNPKPGLLGQVAARMAGVPVVVNTLHGFYFHERMAWPARALFVASEKVAALCSDVILSQNPEDVATAIRLRIARPDQIRLLGNGIDLRRFDPRRLFPETRNRVRTALGVGRDVPVVGFVGRLVAEKGVRDLLMAAAIVAHRCPTVRFLLVGGVDAEKPDRMTPEVAREMGLGDVCVFTGVRQDMPEIYRAMDVFTLPSYREGFPRAPLEAAAMRLPCVVTDVRGCRQAVAHARTGLLVPAGDVEALADALVALIEDPILAARFGEEGRRRALLEFDERRVFATVLAEYERLLADKGLSARIPPSEGRVRGQRLRAVR